MRIHFPSIQYLLLALLGLQLTACNTSGQEQSKLTTPEWTEFKTLATQYDSLQAVFEAMEKEDPSIRTDAMALQQKLGDDLQRVYAIYQAIPQKAQPALEHLEDVGGYGYGDLRVIKLAADATNNLELARQVNIRLLDDVKEADSLNTLRLEIAQYSAALGDVDEAVSYATPEVLAKAEPMTRYQLFQAMVNGATEVGNLEVARRYTAEAVKALKQFGKESAAQLGDDEKDRQQLEMQKQYFVQRYGELLAMLAYAYEQDGDTEALNAFLEESKSDIGESAGWKAVEKVMKDEVQRIRDDRAALNKTAADWAEHFWLNGGPHDLASLKGKVVLVDFFATWCKPCIMAFPHLREWQKKYEDKGLVVVGLTTFQGRYDGSAVDQQAELAKLKDDFIPKHDITWPIGVEKSGRQTMTDYGVNGIPHVVLIDREGKVQYVKVGAADFAKTERKIRQLLGE